MGAISAMKVVTTDASLSGWGGVFDRLFRGNPLYLEWTLHPAVVDPICSRFLRATVDLFVSRGNTQDWCATAQEISFQCPVRTILSFLQDLIDEKSAFFTVKVYLAAILACHVGFDEKQAGQLPLVCRLMKGTQRLLPISKPISPFLGSRSGAGSPL